MRLSHPGSPSARYPLNLLKAVEAMRAEKLVIDVRRMTTWQTHTYFVTSTAATAKSVVTSIQRATRRGLIKIWARVRQKSFKTQVLQINTGRLKISKLQTTMSAFKKQVHKRYIRFVQSDARTEENKSINTLGQTSQKKLILVMAAGSWLHQKLAILQLTLKWTLATTSHKHFQPQNYALPTKSCALIKTSSKLVVWLHVR